MKLKVDQAKEVRRAARTIIGEPSKGRKRGPHRVSRQLKPNEWTEEEVEEAESKIGIDTKEEIS